MVTVSAGLPLSSISVSKFLTRAAALGVLLSLPACDIAGPSDSGLPLEASFLEYPPPSPYSPKNGRLINEGSIVTVRWRIVQRISWYTVQVGRDSLFSSIVETARADTNFHRIGPMENRAYFWRVRAEHVSGIAGPWSPSWSFILGTPGIL